MAQNQYGTRRPPMQPLLVVALLLGVAVGLLVGWQVLPVKWYDTDPSDLRVSHQMNYCMMVADSLVVTGDVDLAKRRLMELTDDDTTWEQVADLVQRAALERKNTGDDASSLRLQRMAQALGMPAVQAAPFEAPRKQVLLPQVSPLYLLAIAVFVAAMVLIVWVLARLLGQGRRQPVVARQPLYDTDQAPADPLTTFETGSAGPPWQSAETRQELDEARFERQAVAIEAVELDLQGELDEEEAEELYESEPDEAEPEPPQPRPTVAPRRAEIIAEREPEEDEWNNLIEEIEGEEPEEAQPEPSWPEPSPASQQALEELPEAPFNALGVFQAIYQHGDDAFDCSYSIEADGEFLGETGVGITDLISGSESEPKVDALEVWLFDKSDIRTVSKLIVSEHAYRDEALRNRLLSKGDLVLAQPGQTLLLETKSLQLTATITACSTASIEGAPNSYFTRLDLELVAERADDL